MNLTPTIREHSAEIIKDFIRSKIREGGSDGAVIGLSGGLDSCVVSKICADSLGARNVLCLIMPSVTTCRRDISDALEFSDKLGVRSVQINIGSVVSEFMKLKKNCTDRTVLGNVTARVRMTLLYMYANSDNLMVIGTGNKSELLTGYFTKFGDGGVDCLPIGDLYKTQVRELAREICIPDHIIQKTPTAGLWRGQTDESELGVSYEKLDKILYGIELGLSDPDIHDRTGLPLKTIASIRRRVVRSAHKRKTPAIPKLGIRTIGADWRE